MTSPSQDDDLPPEEANRKKGVVIMRKIIRARSEGKNLNEMYIFYALVS